MEILLQNEREKLAVMMKQISEEQAHHGSRKHKVKNIINIALGICIYVIQNLKIILIVCYCY